jgi:hypothetical protein
LCFIIKSFRKLKKLKSEKKNISVAIFSGSIDGATYSKKQPMKFEMIGAQTIEMTGVQLVIVPTLGV